MRAIIVVLAALASACFVAAQAVHEQVRVLNAAPTGACSEPAPIVKVSDTGAYMCIGGVWTSLRGFTSSAALTAGYIPAASGPSSIDNSHVDDGVTTPGVVTSTEPISAPAYNVGASPLAASNLSNGTTGSGAVVLAASPTLSGTTTIPTLRLSGTNTVTHPARSYPTWHVPAGGTITLNVPVGGVFWAGEGATIERFTANLAGTNNCSTAPVIRVMDCGTSATCSAPVSLILLTTGTTNGIFDSGAIAVAIATQHFFTAEFTAGNCTGKPSFDAAATLRQN